MRTFVRYLLFQIPGWLLLGLFLGFLLEKAGLSVWAAIGFFVIWVVKDFVMYPIVRRAYETNVRTGSERLIGAKGLTQELLAPQGYIKVQGELWRARVEDHDQPIYKNTVVRVKGADRMTLLVEEEPEIRSRERGAWSRQEHGRWSREQEEQRQLKALRGAGSRKSRVERSEHRCQSWVRGDQRSRAQVRIQFRTYKNEEPHG